MTIAALVCAVAAYALLEMRDTGPPPRDTSAKTYFLWLMLLGPAFIGLALTGLRPIRAYLVTALAGALGLAVVAAIDNEVTNYDNAPGVILVLTFLYGFGLALPGILVAGITRWAFIALRSE